MNYKEVFMKKSTKRILFAVGTSIATIYAYNKFIESTATKKNLLNKENGDYYSWKLGNVFYTKAGTGSPLLLIHDTNSSASSAEWSKIVHRLEKKHTVYCVDLLGCGRSDKPSIEYTNYLYVQLISDFIKDIIQEKTSVIATNMSVSFVVMANHMNPTLFDKLIFINPVSLEQLNIIPDKLSKIKKRIIELPFVGTFIYNLMHNASRIDDSFRNVFFEKPQLISSIMEETYYEAAHMNGSNGRYLYSSILGNYFNNPISHAVKKLDSPTLIIGSKERKRYSLILDDYHKLNPNLDILRITHGNLYPHMEIPEKIVSIIEDYLK